MNLSFSFLPFGQHTGKLSEQARNFGKDILLHLPMEPKDMKWDPGYGALMLSMDKNTIRKKFKTNMAEVPMAIGVNNHMGSRYSENARAMRILLEQVRSAGIFFIDSLTTSESVGYSMAKAMNISASKRDVFLDNVLDKEKITKQLERLISIAEKHGSAIGIGHPNKETLQAVSEFRSELNSRVSLVGIHKLVK